MKYITDFDVGGAENLKLTTLIITNASFILPVKYFSNRPGKCILPALFTTPPPALLSCGQSAVF